MTTRSNLSPTNKFKVELFTLTLASYKLTVTLIVLFSAAAYSSLPAKLTVIIAVPTPTAKISPSLTMATLELLEV